MAEKCRRAGLVKEKKETNVRQIGFANVARRMATLSRFQNRGSSIDTTLMPHLMDVTGM